MERSRRYLLCAPWFINLSAKICSGKIGKILPIFPFFPSGKIGGKIAILLCVRWISLRSFFLSLFYGRPDIRFDPFQGPRHSIEAAPHPLDVAGLGQLEEEDVGSVSVA